MNFLKVADKHFRRSNSSSFNITFSNKSEFYKLMNICQLNSINWASGKEALENASDMYHTMTRGYSLAICLDINGVYLYMTCRRLYSVDFLSIVNDLSLEVIPKSFKEI